MNGCRLNPIPARRYHLSNKMIAWTPPKLRRLKVAYQQAVNAKADTFMLDGHKFVVSYAKYLIEYLTLELAKR